MKESYGGTFMLWLFMFFFVIYITILCVALQFAKTYRVKNKIVNMIEENKYNIYDKPDSLDGKLENYLGPVPYIVNENYIQARKDECDKKIEDGKTQKTYWYYRGVCITTELPEDSTAIYYEVEVYFIVDIPLLLDSGITIPIKGETTRIFIN